MTSLQMELPYDWGASFRNGLQPLVQLASVFIPVSREMIDDNRMLYSETILFVPADCSFPGCGVPLTPWQLRITKKGHVRIVKYPSMCPNEHELTDLLTAQTNEWIDGQIERESHE